MSDFPKAERIFVEFDTAEGAVMRMIGLVERRGFRIRRVAMAEQPCGRRGSLALQIAPNDGGRSVGVLTAQLGRLHGVRRVTHEGDAQVSRAPRGSGLSGGQADPSMEQAA